MRFQKLLAGGLFGTVGAGVAALLWLGTKKADPPKSTPPQPHYRIEMLSEEAGALGKVISVGEPGQGGLSYTCTSQDAAVAWIKITDPGRPEYSGYPQALVSKAKPFCVISHPFGTYCVLALQRGFAVSPEKLDVDIYAGGLGSKRPDGTVTFSKFASPKRIFSRPSGKEQLEAERIARAEFLTHAGALRVVCRPGYQNDFAEIVATSFSAPFDDSTASPLAIDPVIRTYGASTDTVQVQLAAWKRTVQTIVLTYHNAKTLEIGGERILWLPITQKVGSFEGFDAFFEKFSGGNRVSPLGKRFRPKSELRIELDQSPPRLRDPSKIDVLLNLTFIGMTPSLAQMGIDEVRLSANQSSLDTELDASDPLAKSPLTEIPELTIRLRLTTTHRVNLRRIVLPVHVVKSDPASPTNSPVTFGSQTGNNIPHQKA